MQAIQFNLLLLKATLTFPAASLKYMVLECMVAVAKAPDMAPPFMARLSEKRHLVNNVAEEPSWSDMAPPSPSSSMLLLFVCWRRGVEQKNLSSVSKRMHDTGGGKQDTLHNHRKKVCECQKT